MSGFEINPPKNYLEQLPVFALIRDAMGILENDVHEKIEISLMPRPPGAFLIGVSPWYIFDIPALMTWARVPLSSHETSRDIT